MAYFSNSSDGAILDQQCDKCFHKNPDVGCPVAHVQLEFNYDQCDIPKLRECLTILVDITGKCQMKKLVSQMVSDNSKLRKENKKLTKLADDNQKRLF